MQKKIPVASMLSAGDSGGDELVPDFNFMSIVENGTEDSFDLVNNVSGERKVMTMASHEQRPRLWKAQLDLLT